MHGTLKAVQMWLANADPEKQYEVKEYREKRSMSQNAYFHTLSDELADARTLRGDTISKAAQKNELIAKYGQKWRDEEGTPLVIKTNNPPEIMKELENPHTSYIKETEDGAYMYYWFRGSSTYDTREMTALIDGAIEDAKEWGVETLTPQELARIREIEARRNSA